MFSYTANYLTKNGEPWLPMMGEIHFSRVPPFQWEPSLRKMKAGGLSIVSCYVIWLHHEEEEGVFRFSGCRDLRRFLELCKKVGIFVFLRLGPWVHGEVRHGGFPDWLEEKGRAGLRLRSDDPGYLALVRRYWEHLWVEAQGMMFGEGGPVIGVQIENEYGHVGGLRGEAGEQHMRTLTALAREIGFGAPLMTATGWGGACTGGLLPVMGGYCEAPWDQSIGELPPNDNYVFTHERNDALIASDHHVEDALTFDTSKFPYLTAELGGGLQVTRHRRPVATGTDTGAMSLVKLGSGAGLLGYYMYHGGSNPRGALSTLQESRAAGDFNDLPEINYDFNAPIRQFGTISDAYRELRLLALFLNDFGADLAPLPAEIEPDNVSPGDLHTLRLACRKDNSHGYLFFSNYQRRRGMEPHPGALLSMKLGAETVPFPPVDIAPGQYGFFPCRMRLGDAVLRTALAVPLCRLAGEDGDVFVFYGDWDPQFTWEGEARARVLHLSRADALRAAKLFLGRDTLVLSDGFVWEEDGNLVAEGGRRTVVRTFPALLKLPRGFVCTGQEGPFTVYERAVSGVGPEALLEDGGMRGEDHVYRLSFTYPQGRAPRGSGYDVLLTLRWAAESMDVFCGGEKINDYFYTGQDALLSLGTFGFPDAIELVVHPLRADTHVFLERWPELHGGEACRVESASLTEQFRACGEHTCGEQVAHRVCGCI